MAQNKTVGELREYAKSLTTRDMTLLAALYGLQVAQDVVVEQLNDEAPDSVSGNLYPGSALVEDALDFIDDLLHTETLFATITEFDLAPQFDIALAVKVVATAV